MGLFWHPRLVVGTALDLPILLAAFLGGAPSAQ